MELGGYSSTNIVVRGNEGIVSKRELQKETGMEMIAVRMQSRRGLFTTHHGLTSVRENGGPSLLHSENVRTIIVKPGMTEENALCIKSYQKCTATGQT